MKKAIKIAINSIFLATLLLGGLVVQAGGLDNFKLRYVFLTQYFRDRNQDLDDLHKQNVDPAKNTRIDLTQLLNGGPPKDGIPSIDRPRFDTAETTPFGEDEVAIGVVVNGEAKAYPLGIMNWHEIVNDTVGGVNLTISYCPLCDTIVAFERGNTTYGVSGKLYQSCLVMYDRADETLYSQPWALGIVGQQVNRSLPRLPAVKTTLGNWLAKYPDSKILSTDTGHNRNYLRYPYGSYYTNDEIVFPVRNQEARSLHPKAIIGYVWGSDDRTPMNHFSGDSYAFVHREIQRIGTQVVDFGDRKIRIRWDDELQTAIAEELDRTPIPSSTAFAFVYPAFFPN